MVALWVMLAIRRQFKHALRGLWRGKMAPGTRRQGASVGQVWVKSGSSEDGGVTLGSLCILLVYVRIVLDR